MHSCLSFCIIVISSSMKQQRRVARLRAAGMLAAGSVDPGAVAKCPEQEQELSETFQPTGEMITTYSKRVSLSELTLEAYMVVFDLLTKGTGSLVQPNLDATKFITTHLRLVNHWHCPLIDSFRQLK